MCYDVSSIVVSVDSTVKSTQKVQVLTLPKFDFSRPFTSWLPRNFPTKGLRSIEMSNFALLFQVVKQSSIYIVDTLKQDTIKKLGRRAFLIFLFVFMLII